MSDSDNDAENEQHTKQQRSQKPRRELTLKDLKDEILRNPSAYLQQQPPSKKYKRTRKRVENPKQTYMYASQRLKLRQESNPETAEGVKTEKVVAVVVDHPDVVLARQLGMISWQQYCDPEMENMEPKIMGIIRVSEDVEGGPLPSEDSLGTTKYLESVAFIIDKPAGWSVSGSKSSTATKPDANKVDTLPATSLRPSGSESTAEFISEVEDTREYNEMDLLAVMTPQERAEYEAEMGKVSSRPRRRKTERLNFFDGNDEMYDDSAENDVVEYNEADLLAVMTTEEKAEYEAANGSVSAAQANTGGFESTNVEGSLDLAPAEESKGATPPNRKISEQTSLNLRKIAARISASKGRSDKEAVFARPPRPSIMSWLRGVQTRQGMPIRGSKYWVALAGATDVDDSGLVLVCPKGKASNLFIDSTDYIVVVGNGGNMAPKTNEAIKGATCLEIVSRLKRGRGDDSVTTVKFTVQEKASTCTAVVQACQSELGDGIRGDPTANPLDRRAPRRLIHCNSMTVSSLAFDDESVQTYTETWPDDIAVLANRKHHVFTQGSFLGRSTFRYNPQISAYREINGEGDGFPGWTVERYGKWLLVQHDPSQLRGPLPSIHDGNTAGVYYHQVNSNRNAAGVARNDNNQQARLQEGQAAPEIIPILENGITYHVSLDTKDLSTIFLDQRPLRAWLSRHCQADTRVLNCFAGQGGGSLTVAAAVAGASTVSLDLNKNRLDCIPEQLQANGIEYDERHDSIYGDCLDWLSRLSKRGEKYDLVIINPPNSFVGKKMKRWNVKDEMDELVSLAAPLVKPNGFLWTITRSATLPMQKLAKLCYKGLEQATNNNFKLERIQPMPSDFPTIGAQPMKCLMWRISK